MTLGMIKYKIKTKLKKKKSLVKNFFKINKLS